MGGALVGELLLEHLLNYSTSLGRSGLFERSADHRAFENKPHRLSPSSRRDDGRAGHFFLLVPISLDQAGDFPQNML